MHNLKIFLTQEKRVDFSEVTGVSALSFRNLSVGETADPDVSGQCGGANLPAIASRSDEAGGTPPQISCEVTKSRSLDRETEEKPILFKEI